MEIQRVFIINHSILEGYEQSGPNRDFITIASSSFCKSFGAELSVKQDMDMIKRQTFPLSRNLSDHLRAPCSSKV